MQLTPHLPFWRRTPPALFPPVLGLVGLGLAWRRAEEAFGFGAEIGDLILGAVTLIYLSGLACYIAKLIKRPGVFQEDLRVLPGRAGLAAMVMTAALLSLVALPIWPWLAKGILVIALVLHVVLAGLVVATLVAGPAEQRQVNPVWHLTFVGFIAGGVAAADMGLGGLATPLLWVTMVVMVAIYAVSLMQLFRKAAPPPLRPLLAIHLAPISLGCTSASLLGFSTLALIFGLVACLVLAILLVSARHITVAGFSPFWGAFTFPLAAFSSAMLLLGQGGQTADKVFMALGAGTLIAGTIAIPWIAARVLQLWVKGTLATRTNAAIA